MNPNIVFSGRIGSGKTQVSKAVAAALGYRWNSFGVTLKAIAVDRDLPTTRESLQELGATMVAEAPEELCSRLLVGFKPEGLQSMIIDGLRHQHVYSVLQSLFLPSPLLLVYVDVLDPIRLQRLSLRDSKNIEEIHCLDQHSTEVQVATNIRNLADFVVDNSGQLTSTLSSVLDWLASNKNVRLPDISK